MSESSDQQLIISQQWVDKIVVGLNLCPFAKPVIKSNSLRYVVNHSIEHSALIKFFLTELQLIQAADELEIATSLLIIPKALVDFYEYLDFVADCEALLKKAELEGEFQLASFHPQYLFAGVEEDDLSHYTNRSPYPMLHLIREAQMTRVLEKHPNPDSIPERNIQLLRELGKEELAKRFGPLEKY